MQIEEQLNRIERKIDNIILSLQVTPVIIDRDEKLIRNVILNYFNISLSEFQDSGRVYSLNIVPRHFFYFFTKSLTDMSLRQMGMFINKKDHSTVLNGITRVCEWIDTNDKQMMLHYHNLYAILEHKGLDVNKIKTFLIERKDKQMSSLKALRNNT
jgi:chromosomal replication initiation ATPase DnaA